MLPVDRRHYLGFAATTDRMGRIRPGSQAGLNEVNMLSPNPFRLVTLGRLALLTPDGAPEEALGKQRRKLAVLAVLALSRTPIARDALIEMFWGDQDDARARHSLNEALSHLRRVLGRDAIARRQVEVTLADERALVVDAVEFEKAVAAGEYRRARELYGGPLLDAVYVGGSASFEEWVEGERSRLERLFLEACRKELRALAHDGREEERAAIARRWLATDPFSAEAAVAYLEALRGPGTAEADARALQEYERLRARLEREFELPPDPAVVALAEQIRARLEARPAAVTTATAAPASASTAPPPAVPTSRIEEPRLRAVRARRRWMWVALGVGVLAVVAAAFISLRRPAPDAAVVSNRVAVLPFRIHGGDELGYLREGIVDLLSINLDGAGSYRSVDPRAVLGYVARSRTGALTPEDGRAVAERFDAGLYVLGDVIEAGGRVRLMATLYDRGRRPLAQASVEGTPSEIFVLVDRLTVQLMAARSREPAEQLARIAALTSSSLPALKAYLEGEGHYRAGRYGAAFEAFRSAVIEDSTFALAHYRLSLAANWAVAWPWDSIVASSGRAAARAERLNRHARLLVEALHAYHLGAYDDAERHYRAVLASHPSYVEAWFQLGEVLFHCNTMRGRSFVESREPFERTLELDPEHRGAIVHLLRVAAFQGQDREVRYLLDRAIAFTPGDWSLELRAFQAFTLGNPSDRDRAVAELRSADAEVVRVAAFRIGLYARDLEGAERIARLLTDPRHRREERAIGHIYLAELALAGGKWEEADGNLAAAERLNPTIALEHRALLSLTPFVARPVRELQALHEELAEWNGSAPDTDYPVLAVYNGIHPHIRTYLLGVLSVRLGDLAAAENSAFALDAMQGGQGVPFARGLAASVRGHTAAARGDRAAALALFERGRLQVPVGLLESAIGAQAYERFHRAELLHAAGRDDDALVWYGSIAETSMDQLVYLGPAHLRQAQIHERQGRPRQASEHYTRFVELWSDSDPTLQPLVEWAQGRLDRLRGQTS